MYTWAMLDRDFAEKVNKSYVPEAALLARQKAWQTIDRIARTLKVGMTEGDAILLSRDIFEEEGAEKHWHKPVVRFGQGTSKSFAQPFDPDQPLRVDDIFFLDFGPVYNNIEADVGKTFLLGSDPERQRCIRDTEALWADMRKVWCTEKLSGRDLYAFGIERAKALGWNYKLDGAEGHRLGDFPHKLHYEGNMISLGFTPSPYLWVLEVQLVDPQGRFGAFYEDILY